MTRPTYSGPLPEWIITKESSELLMPCEAIANVWVTDPPGQGQFNDCLDGFTDGSRQDGNSGAGFCCPTIGKEISLPLGNMTTPSLSSIPDNLMNQKGVVEHVLSNDNGGVDAVNRRETFSRANSIKEPTGCVKSDDGLSVGSNAITTGTKTATILVSKTKTKTGLPLLLKNSIN
ncbi:hypothetical protein Bhyg_05066 [Pseudolycoriella hygida]|uniref:Uncharacterized protein n=1 Tax=Pseudolycoriella hygida TaxID=35572 RepID=A0A9Q0NGF6_9DIPT|nr:hypothetical protein Bhyg_05066 [Pseudolycoriella hygida]